MTDGLILRKAARVLLVDPGDRVLMLRGCDPATPDERFWVTVGGGLQDGESARDGAARELFEETGLHADPTALVGPVLHEVVDFPLEGLRYRQDQLYFLLRVDGWTVDTSGFEPLERATIDAWRWWSAAALRATDETWYPAVLPDLLDHLLAGGEPDPAGDGRP